MLRTEQDLDWQKLIVRAKGLRCRRILFLGIYLAKDLLRAEVPANVWQEIVKDSVVLELAGEVREKMFPDRNAAATIFDHRRFFLRTREKLRDRSATSTTITFEDISTKRPLKQLAKRMPHRQLQRKRRRRHPAPFTRDPSNPTSYDQRTTSYGLATRICLWTKHHSKSGLTAT